MQCSLTEFSTDLFYQVYFIIIYIGIATELGSAVFLNCKVISSSTVFAEVLGLHLSYVRGSAWLRLEIHCNFV